MRGVIVRCSQFVPARILNHRCVPKDCKSTIFQSHLEKSPWPDLGGAATARTSWPGQKWQFAEYALQHAYEALDGLIYLMRNAESEAVRLKAIDRILDRALGKAQQHADVSALRHTEIVYRSAEEIRKALIEAGAPPVLLDLTDDEEDDDAADNADHA